MPNREIKNARATEQTLVSDGRGRARAVGPARPVGVRQISRAEFDGNDGRPKVGPADDATRRRLLDAKLNEKGDGNLYRAPPPAQPARKVSSGTDIAMGVSALGDPGGNAEDRIRRSGG